MHEHAEKLPLTSSFISELDPRLKILGIIYFIFFVIATKPGSSLSFYCFAFILLALMFLAKIPFSVFARRYLMVLPFLLIIMALLPFIKKGETVFVLDLKLVSLRVTDAGLETFLSVFIKSLFSLCSLVIISATTSFSAVTKSLKDLKVPLVMVIILTFMYRYLYLMLEGLRKMKMAVDARNFGRNRINRIRALASCIAVFFLKSYERSEFVYRAMVSRNFKKDSFFKYNFELGFKDVTFFVVFIILISLSYLGGFVLKEGTSLF